VTETGTLILLAQESRLLFITLSISLLPLVTIGVYLSPPHPDKQTRHRLASRSIKNSIATLI